MEAEALQQLAQVIAGDAGGRGGAAEVAVVLLEQAGEVAALEGVERGLLGLAFAPDYATSGYFYLYYTSSVDDGDYRTVVLLIHADQAPAPESAPGQAPKERHVYSDISARAGV